MPASTNSIHSTPDSAHVAVEQVERILRSETFRSCEALRNLLSFLASCVAYGRAEPLKVKEIAKVVFGRSEHFDSQSDSVVRVQMGRLRSKLAEYYVDEGDEDKVIVTVPKGSYALVWHTRHHPATAEPLTSEVIPVRAVAVAASRRNHYLAIVIAVLVSSTGLAFWGGTAVHSRSANGPDTPALRTFWRGFLAGNEAPLIVFSNQRLIGSVESGLHIDRSVPWQQGQPVIDSWTTIGEVMGVFDITRTLSLFRKPTRIKHGQLLTWDEARDSNLIFVGGPLADTPLRDISMFGEFQFENGRAGIPAESGAVVNVHPRKGEARVYLGPEARPFQFDYAVVSLRPGFNREHRILALAGVTEYGTVGAADFLTREDQVSDLLARLNVRAGERIPWFEALLRIRLNRGVPVQNEIVLIHKVAGG